MFFEKMHKDDFEQVIHCNDPRVGLKAIISIHSTALGPATGGCRLNVVLSAYNAQAQPTDRLIIGENEPGCCGITAQDKGRVNAVRLRPVVPGPAPSGQVTTYLTSKPLVTSVPVRDTVSEGKTVVLPQPLDNLRKNEQLAVSANVSGVHSAAM